MSQSALKVLVTGGAGFIGSHLVDALLAQHIDVNVLDNFSTGKHDHLTPHAHLNIIEGDVRDADQVSQAAEGVNVIVHLAAVASVQKSIQEPMMTHAVNFGGTLNVLEAARLQQVKRVLFASSAAVYGDIPQLPAVENAALNPLTPYAIDKLASERYLDFYRRTHGIETASFRFFNIFGSRQDPASPYSGVISIFVASALAGKPLTVYGDGQQTRDFICVEDVISILLQAVTTPTVYTDPLNIGNGTSISLQQLIAMLESILNKKITVNYQPARPGDIRHSRADIQLLNRHYKKEETRIVDGLARLISSLH
jgi:UDP-glucose 4-epimerase